MRQLRLLIGTLVTVGLLAGLVVSPAYGDPPFAPPGLDRAIAAQERHTNQVLAIPNVVGTAVGFGADGRPVVKIYTESAEVAGLPRLLDGVPVVVQVTGKLFALKKPSGSPGKGPGSGTGDSTDPTSRFARPVPIGVSTGHPNITAGTIGCRVTDGTDVYALSNNHVYADSNDAFIGNNVLQPGVFDGGKDPADAIGTLDDFEPIDFTGGDNTFDAAIALSSVMLLDNATPSDGYILPKSTTVSASLNQRVQKYGRTTGLTKGKVTAINFTGNITYNSGVARFVNQIVIESTRRRSPFSRGGDSGSLIVSDDREPVGLLFAGGSFLGSDITIASPIDEVLTRFGVTIDGE